MTVNDRDNNAIAGNGHDHPAAGERIVVTGGAGFIGANFVLDWIAATGEAVVNLDKLTYAGNLENLRDLEGDAGHVFVKGDIGNRELLAMSPGSETQDRIRGVVRAVEREYGFAESFLRASKVGGRLDSPWWLWVAAPTGAIVGALWLPRLRDQ